jgi:hypothetical protein
MFLTRCHYVDQIKKDDMGRACDKFRGDMRCCRIFIRKPEGKNNMEDVDVYDRIILKWIQKADERVWSGFIWLILGTSGMLLWKR